MPKGIARSPATEPPRVREARRRDEILAYSVASRYRSGGCWVDWPGPHDADGYPRHREPKVARLVLEVDGRPCPGFPRNQALHSCDNTACWNPAHLRWGTLAENMRDKAVRGRAARLQGALHGGARLTEQQARGILAEHAGGAAQKDLADRYGVSPVTVHNIVRAKTWRHLHPGEAL